MHINNISFGLKNTKQTTQNKKTIRQVKLPLTPIQELSLENYQKTIQQIKQELRKVALEDDYARRYKATKGIETSLDNATRNISRAFGKAYYY